MSKRLKNRPVILFPSEYCNTLYSLPDSDSTRGSKGNIKKSCSPIGIFFEDSREITMWPYCCRSLWTKSNWPREGKVAERESGVGENLFTGYVVVKIHRVAWPLWPKPHAMLGCPVKDCTKLLLGLVRALRWFLGIALRIPAAHDFRVLNARKRARTRRKRFPSNWAR